MLLDPKWLLELAHGPADHAPGSPDSNGEPSDSPPDGLLNVPGGLAARVLSNLRVTSPAHWQDVRHLTLSIANYHPYVPGDVLTIYPKNFPADVNEFLRVMGWTSIADSPLKFVPSSPNIPSSSPLPIPSLSLDTPITLRALITNHLDIMSIPRRSFFAQLAHFTNDEFHRERLLEFTNPEYIDELYDYTTRPRRSILEVLQEFESVKIPWPRLCSIIPSMRGRQFSIASAQQPSAQKSNGTIFELLIAIVKYKTVIKRIRQGVCTRYIASLAPGQEISVTLHKGGLGVTKNESEKPVVMIGPGTGVAPMRALIYQRKYWREEMQPVGGPPGDLLFFGCRNAEADYFFKEEWQQLKSEGVCLDVMPAFSRDQVCLHYVAIRPYANHLQRQKVYVQDLIREHSARVYDSLFTKTGIVYICGSSGKMPQAVREALIESFQYNGSMNREEAEAYLAGMEKSGRYKQETW